MVSLWRDDGFWGNTHLNDYGFGYFLDPKERGNGLITQSVQRLIQIVSSNLRVRQFIAFCEDDNYKSAAVLARLSFQPTDEVLSAPDTDWQERKYILPVSNLKK